MKLSTVLRYHWLIALVLAAICLNVEARGGRRGGSSLGSLLGGLRKHKKHPSGGGSSRRTINGSPMHVSQSLTPAKQTRVRQQQNKQRPTQGSYPRQPTHSGNIDGPLLQHRLHSQQNELPHYTPPLPPGGVYYTNPSALPSHAVYYAQPPVMHSSTGDADFLTGLMVTNALTHRHRHDDYHVRNYYQERLQHRQQQQQQNMSDSATAQTIIIDNTNAADGSVVQVVAPRRRHKWPTAHHTPLAPFNTTITPEELTQPSVTPIFKQRPKQHQHAASETSTAPTKPAAETQISTEPSSATGAALPPTTLPAYGIICVPMLLNETDPHEPSKIQTVEKLVCYPAPPPPSPSPPSSSSADSESLPAVTAITADTTPSAMGAPAAPPAAASFNALPLYTYDTYQQQQQQQLMRAAAAPLQPHCVMRTFVERDPNDGTKTIEVQREYCNTATTQKVQIAGEINESEHENVNAATAMPTINTSTTITAASVSATPSTTNVAALQSTSTSSGAAAVTTLNAPTIATISERLKQFP